LRSYVEGIDDLLAFGQCLNVLVAASQEGVGGHGQVLGHYGEQFDDLALDALQLTLEFLSVFGHMSSLGRAAARFHPQFG
jgi:hypothetical protein